MEFLLVFVCLLKLCLSQLFEVRYAMEPVFSQKLFDQLLSILLSYNLWFKVKLGVNFVLRLKLMLKKRLLAWLYVLRELALEIVVVIGCWGEMV